jgi:hypothetical protein
MLAFYALEDRSPWFILAFARSVLWVCTDLIAGEETMRTVLACVAALSLLVSLTGEAAAETQAKKHKRFARNAVPAQQYGSPKPSGTDGYVERDANKMPFGSAMWWEQMQREGRLGGERP